MEFKDALKRFRKTYSLTQSQAAAIAGVSISMYQFYEYGRHEPTLSALLTLADYFNVSLDYLCGRSDDPERH